MNVLTSLGIVFLAMLIGAFLQLVPGIFSIFYHSALAKNSAKKADDLALSFILGTEIFNTLILLSVFSIVAYLAGFHDFINGIFPFIMAGIFGALSVVSIFSYFKKQGTTLFIPRKVAKNFSLRAKNVKTRTDALVLGFFAGVPELLFTLPIFLILSLETLKISSFPNFFVLILYIIIATVPLFTLRTFFRGGLNLADIEKLRIKNKPFFRLTITIAFLLLALLTITLGINL